MEKVMILTGLEENLQKRIEIYQLLINCNFIHTSYDGSSDRDLFFEEIGDAFTSSILERIAKGGPSVVIGTVNGLWINPETKNHEPIPKLEEEYVTQVSRLINDKVMKFRKPGLVLMPASPRLIYPSRS